MLFIGDDWAEDHHDVEVQDEQGKTLKAARLPEGIEGMTRLHELIAGLLPTDSDPEQVLICIETDRGLWVRALVAAGYEAYGVNPKTAARHRELLSLSGAKDDKADAKTLADMLRTRRHQLRTLAADSDEVAAIQAALRSEHLSQAEIVAGAYAASARATIAVLRTLNEQIKLLEGEVESCFGRHPDAEVYLSQPGMGVITGARVLAEFGDAENRYVDAKSRKNYAGTAPVTRQSGKTKTVHARFVHNDRLIDALHNQAHAAMLHDAGARAYYQELRGWEMNHNAALRQLGNRLVGILHASLKTKTLYNQAAAWSHRYQHLAA